MVSASSPRTSPRLARYQTDAAALVDSALR